ncbi:MAG: SMC-Scp complex subunit ScpB [Blastocatellia bacterium]
MNNENNDLPNENNDLSEPADLNPVSPEPAEPEPVDPEPIDPEPVDVDSGSAEAVNAPEADDLSVVVVSDEEPSTGSDLEAGEWFEESEGTESAEDVTALALEADEIPAVLPGQLDGTEAETETPDDSISATREEIKPVIESLLFVAEEPLPLKVICKVLGIVPEEEVQQALDTLIAEYDERACGLEIREVAGGWRISTRPQNHDFIRKYLKTRPSARLSLPALETLAVIAYKQPITVPEILEIRGVSSSSAIKTLLEKRLIVTKGRKETVGRPMMYGTSREFLIQFGLKDLSELPSIEDFEDLAQ